MLLDLLPHHLITTMTLLPHLDAPILQLAPNMTATPQQFTIIPSPRRSPTAPDQPWRRTYSTIFGPRRCVSVRGSQVRAPFLDQLGKDMVEEGGGGGHAAAEDGGGEFACGPEGRGLEVESFVRVAGVEGDDEAHDGGDAGAAGVLARRTWSPSIADWIKVLESKGGGRGLTIDRRQR